MFTTCTNTKTWILKQKRTTERKQFSKTMEMISGWSVPLNCSLQIQRQRRAPIRRRADHLTVAKVSALISLCVLWWSQHVRRVGNTTAKLQPADVTSQLTQHTLLAVRVHCNNLSEARVYVSSPNTVSNWSTTETMRKKLLKSTNNKYTFCYVHKVSHTYLKYDNILDMNETLFIVFHHSVIIRDPPKLEY